FSVTSVANLFFAPTKGSTVPLTSTSANHFPPTRRDSMRRKYVLGCALALLAGSLAAAWIVRPTRTPPLQQIVAKTAAENAPNLPLSQVVLFSSGVGYFQREGEVEGNARVDLSFPVQDINDLLKSMVLQDLGNGHVSAVSYDSHDPIDKTLKSFAVNLTSNPTLAQILN